MIQSQSFEARSQQVWLVLRRRRPLRRAPESYYLQRCLCRPDLLRKRRITKACCDQVVPPLCPVWVVLRWARPPRREANHDGMLRLGVPRGDVTPPKCGWCCAGPGLLGERPITTACCEQQRRREKQGGGEEEERRRGGDTVLFTKQVPNRRRVGKKPKQFQHFQQQQQIHKN